VKKRTAEMLSFVVKKSIHVGKDLFRSKEHEEDIMIINEITSTEFPVSLKAYGDGPLQLSTDSRQKLFPFLVRQGNEIQGEEQIKRIFDAPEFSEFGAINVMPLIYDEKNLRCNIMIFDHEKAKRNTKRIVLVNKGQRFDEETGKVVSGRGRSHPIYMFIDSKDNYICETRYGGASANALQRGLWTHTKNAVAYFDSLTNGWIDYSHNLTLVKLFSLALNSSEKGHLSANEILQSDIDRLKRL